LILSNPLNKTVIGTLALSSDLASHRPVALVLTPGETKRLDLRELLGVSNNGAAGGLRLSLPGKEPISATQIVFDEITGLAAIMKLFERQPDDQPKSHLLRAPMMALSQPDPALAFPAGTQLVPRMFLRNAAPTPIQVTASIDWRNQSAGTLALPSLTFSPGEVRVISLADYQQAGQIPYDANWATLKLAYTGRRADLVAIAISYDKDNRYGLQTPFSEALSHLWVGGMWHVNATHNTLITTGNGGPEATRAEVTLFYNGGKGVYRTEMMLPPGQQLWLDVGHLVRDQVPDSGGHTLPVATMTGSYELRDLDHQLVGQLYEGKLVIDKTYGHASYGCGGCCGYTVPEMDPGTFTGGPDVDNDDSIYSTESCGGGNVDVTDAAYDWASSDTAVALLPSPTLHTVAPGTASGSADLELPWDDPRAGCPTQIFTPVQNPITVVCAVPTNYSQTSGSGDSQGFLHFTYSWGSSTGHLSDLAACTVREYVTYPGTSPFNWPSPPYSTASTPFPVTLGVSGTAGTSSDTHSYPGFQQPYQANSFTATQYYQYICPCANGGQPVDLMGPLSITRQVYFSSPNGKWTYQASKSGVNASVVLPNQ